MKTFLENRIYPQQNSLIFCLWYVRHQQLSKTKSELFGYSSQSNNFEKIVSLIYSATFMLSLNNSKFDFSQTSHFVFCRLFQLNVYWILIYFCNTFNQTEIRKITFLKLLLHSVDWILAFLSIGIWKNIQYSLLFESLQSNGFHVLKVT